MGYMQVASFCYLHATKDDVSPNKMAAIILVPVPRAHIYWMAARLLKGLLSIFIEWIVPNDITSRQSVKIEEAFVLF